MYGFIALSGMFLIISSCRPTPFQVKPLSDKGLRYIAPTDKKSDDNFDSALRAGLSQRYNKAQRPVFAIIDGYYRLPNASPYGAARLVQSYSYQTYVESIEFEGGERPAALSPIKGDEAIALHQAMNTLLDMGVRLYEISMSNALAVADAEREAMKNKSSFLFPKHVLPNVDYLMSIYKTQSKRGPIFVGRVIAKDGRLLAFRVMHHGSHDAMIGSLILSLFEDAINRI